MTNNNPKVSVIVPVKNGEKSIKKTIDSILNQTYKNIECIVVHGDSIDDTKKILDKEYSFIKVIHGKDKSIADAMNKGIKLSSGSLISILNSGDYYTKNTVNFAVKEHILNKEMVLHGNMRVFFDNGKYYDEIAPKNPNLLLGMVINHPTMFIPKILMKKNGLYDDSFEISCDWELCIRYMFKNVNFKKINDEILVNYEVGGISTQKPLIIIKEAHKIRKMHKLFNCIDFKYIKGLILYFIFGNKITIISHKKKFLFSKFFFNQRNVL